METTCIQCQGIFQAQRRTARYCSRLCRYRWQGAERKVAMVAAHRQQVASNKRTLTEAQRLGLAWLAGLIDGEGTVSLSHGSRKTPNLRIIVYNTATPIVAKIQTILDDLGIVYFTRWDRRFANHCAAIRIGNEGTLALHPLLRPYLVRQIERYGAAVAFLADRYTDRHRVYWRPEDLAAWEVLRARFNR